MTNPSVMISASDRSSLDSIDFLKNRASQRQAQQIVDWTKKQFWRMKEDRNYIERQWYLNLAFFFGKQYVAFRRTGTPTLNNNTSLLWIPPAPSWRARLVVNRMRSTVRTELAQLTNNKPNATVVPASAEERDMYAAMAAEQVWEYLSSTKKFKKVIRDAVWWKLTCGNSYIKTWWDFDAGNIMIPDTEQKMGKPCFAPVDPFHVFVPDLLETEIEDQPYLIHAQLKPADYIKLNYAKALQGKSVSTQETTGREIFESAFLNIVGAPYQMRNMVLVFECWIKPGMHPMFPEGGMYTIIGDTIVQNYQGNPYSHGKYPLAKLDHIPSGKYYTTSSIEDLIPLQKEYNRTWSQIVENKNRMGKLQIMHEEGAVDPRKWTTEPGQMIAYKGGFGKPEVIPAAPLPAYIPQTLDRIIADWNDISGQHEVTHGQVPPGVTAATAISFLQERDETKLSPTFDAMEEAIEKTAYMALTLVHDYWTVEQTIQVTGVESSFDSLTFKGSDLPNEIDIRTEAGSSLPINKAARQAFIFDLMKMGFIKPDDGLEVLDMGGISKIYERVQVDRRQAQRENMKLSKITSQFIQQYDTNNQMAMMADPNHFGQEQAIDPATGQPAIDPMTGQPVMQPKSPPPIVPVNSWDNHQAHIYFHNNYRKGQAFETLPDEVKQLFEQHVQAHIAAMGAEQVTMQPRAVAGLPPTDPYNPQGQQLQQQGPGMQPGPAPMPGLATEGMG